MADGSGQITIKADPEHLDDMVSMLRGYQAAPLVPAAAALTPPPAASPVLGRSILGTVPSSSAAEAAGNVTMPTAPGNPSVPAAPIPRTKLGEVGHILGTVGDIAGSAFVPHLMPWIPGTPQHKMMLAQEAETQAGEEAKNRLTGAESDLAEARAKALGEPEQKPATEKMQAFQSLVGKGVDPMEAYRQVEEAGFKPDAAKTEKAQWVKDKQGNLLYLPDSEIQQHQGDYTPDKSMGGMTPFGLWMKDPHRFAEWIDANKKNTGLGTYAMVRLLTEAYRNDPRLLAVLPEIFKNMGMPMPPGVNISGPPPGQPREPGTGQPIGLAQPEAPTPTIRTRGQMAQDALLRLPDIRQSIENLQGELGPVQGRWNEFMTGKVGAPNEKFAKLRDNLEFLAGAITRLHLNTEKGLQPFMNMMSAGKMSPENLKAALNAVEDWSKTYAYTGSGNQPRLAPGAAKGGAGAQPLGATSKPDGIYEMNGKRYRVEGGKVYGD